MSKVKVCECCGHPLPTIDVMRDLTKMQGKILIELNNAGQAGLPLDVLVRRVYADDPTGGPVTAPMSTRVQLHKMQFLLAPYGLRIASQRGGVRRLQAIDVV